MLYVVRASHGYCSWFKQSCWSLVRPVARAGLPSNFTTWLLQAGRSPPNDSEHLHLVSLQRAALPPEIHLLRGSPSPQRPQALALALRKTSTLPFHIQIDIYPSYSFSYRLATTKSSIFDLFRLPFLYYRIPGCIQYRTCINAPDRIRTFHKKKPVHRRADQPTLSSGISSRSRAPPASPPAAAAPPRHTACRTHARRR